MKNALAIFIKNPIAGKVKTRLAATIGHPKAYEVYVQLLHHTRLTALQINAALHVFYDAYIDQKDEWDNDAFNKHLQQGKDLGEKMFNAFNRLFSNRYQNIAIIGSDCPGITPVIINQAFLQLKDCDVVIGPASDGGYYLLAMKQLYAGLFQDIQWSTATVLQETLKLCNQNNLNVHLLPALPDIDVEEDLIHLKNINKVPSS